MDGELVELSASKRAVLLAFLAERADSWVSRDALTLLLWADRPETKARRALRQMLHEVSAGPMAGALEIEDDRVRFAGSSDASMVRTAHERSAWNEVLALGSEPFLGGWSLPREPAADAWIVETRDRYASFRRDAFLGRSAELERVDDLGAAADALGRVWREDVLETEAFVRQLWLLQQVHAGRARSEAQRFRDAFDREMGVPPEGDLGAVVDAAIEGRPLDEPRPITVVRRGPTRLPVAGTPFVGRARELEDLRARVEDPQVRLVSIIGIGGSGKTRLAREVAAQAARRGANVAWASLVDAESASAVPEALTEAWGLEGPNAGRLDALAEHIGSRRSLLVVDNADDLASGVGTAVVELVGRCPMLTVLVTSRRAIDVRAEHRVILGGLETTPASDATKSEAAALLEQTALRRHHGFEADLATLEAIATEVGGHPLALELIGSWADVATAAEMLEDVQMGLERLGTEFAEGLADVPGRQQGLRVVLDATWSRLSEVAKEAMLALAPCRGGFDADAAHALGVPRVALRELAAAALVTRSASRFARHPLIAADARERARRDVRWPEWRARHGSHYLETLASFHHHALAGAGRAIRRAVWRDVENARSALVWGVEHAAFGDVDHALAVMNALDSTGELADATWVRAVTEAADRTDDPRTADLVRLYTWDTQGAQRIDEVRRRAKARGDSRIEAHALLTLASLELEGATNRSTASRVDVDRAAVLSRRGLELRRSLATSDDVARQVDLAASYRQLGRIEGRRARYGAARHLVRRGAVVCRRAGLSGAACTHLQALVAIALFTGDYGEAIRLYEAIANSRPPDRAAVEDAVLDRWGGWALMNVGRLDEAEAVFLKSGEASHELLGDLREHHERMVENYLAEIEFYRGRFERALELNAKGDDNPLEYAMGARILWAMGEIDEAHERFEHSLRAVRKADARSGPIAAGAGLAYAASWLALLQVERGDVDSARTLVLEALDIATHRKLPPGIARAFLPAARLLASDGDAEGATHLVRMVEAGDHVTYGTKLRVRTVARAHGLELGERLDASEATPQALLAQAESLIQRWSHRA